METGRCWGFVTVLIALCLPVPCSAQDNFVRLTDLRLRTTELTDTHAGSTKLPKTVVPQGGTVYSFRGTRRLGKDDLVITVTVAPNDMRGKDNRSILAEMIRIIDSTRSDKKSGPGSSRVVARSHLTFLGMVAYKSIEDVVSVSGTVNRSSMVLCVDRDQLYTFHAVFPKQSTAQANGIWARFLRGVARDPMRARVVH